VFRTGHLFTRVVKRLRNEADGILVRPDILISLYVDPVVGLERRRRLSGEPVDPICADMTFLRHHAEFFSSVVPTFPSDTVIVIDTTDLRQEDAVTFRQACVNSIGLSCYVHGVATERLP